MLVYLSGPMTGQPEYNYPAFAEAAAGLRAAGFHIINPAETAGGTTHLPRSTYLRIDIGYVMAADAIALMPGWEESNGAKLEVMVAQAMDLPVYELLWDGWRGWDSGNVLALGDEIHVGMVAGVRLKGGGNAGHINPNGDGAVGDIIPTCVHGTALSGRCDPCGEA